MISCSLLRWDENNTLRPRQNGRRFADDTFKRIFLNENVRILIKISLKFVPKGPMNNSPALVQIMTWRRSGDKPLSEPMMVSLLTHICVTRPQWDNIVFAVFKFLVVRFYLYFACKAVQLLYSRLSKKTRLSSTNSRKMSTSLLNSWYRSLLTYNSFKITRLCVQIAKYGDWYDDVCMHLILGVGYFDHVP